MTSHAWPENPEVLHLARRTNHCTVLGPGVRAVLWVQGCPFRCPGCVAPETLPFAGGVEVRVDTLAQELSALSDIEGVTFSGGEPMAQAAALCALIDAVRGRRDLSFLSYTGYTLEYHWANHYSRHTARKSICPPRTARTTSTSPSSRSSVLIPGKSRGAPLAPASLRVV